MKHDENTLPSVSRSSLNASFVVNVLISDIFVNFYINHIIHLYHSLTNLKKTILNSQQLFEHLYKQISGGKDTNCKRKTTKMIEQQIKFSTEYSYRIKLLVLGAKQSGKSSFIYTYKHENPPKHKITSQETDTIIKKIKYIKANKQGSQKQHFQCNIHLWDTTADQTSDILNNILLKRVNALLLVFDRQSRSSFDRMRAIWAKIEEQRKKLYHVQVILIGNLKEKHPNILNKEGDMLFGFTGREGYGSNRRKKNSFIEDDYIRPQRNDVVVEDFNNLIGSRIRKNEPRRNIPDSPIDQTDDFSNQIKAFQESQECAYYEMSVHDPGKVRQVFQGLLGKIMKNIEEGKINLQDAVIKDTQGKIKLRKFDFKTYEYFEKRYNKCC